MPLTLSEETEKIICKRLKINNLEDVVDQDYPDITPDDDVDREATRLYSSRNRGSVRISRGLFHTMRELAEQRKNDESLTFS